MDVMDVMNDFKGRRLFLPLAGSDNAAGRQNHFRLK
jgi:hypothetical protein